MKEIKVNLDHLNYQIAKLKQLQTDIQNYSIKQTALDGNGNILQKAKEIEDFYLDLKKTYSNLIGDSIVFFEHAMNNYAEADNAAAEKIAGGGE